MARNFFTGHNPFSTSSSASAQRASGPPGDRQPRIHDVPEDEDSLKSPTQPGFSFNAPNSTDAPESLDALAAAAGATAVGVSSRNSGSNPNPAPPTVFGGSNPPTSPSARPPSQLTEEGEPLRQPFAENPFGVAAGAKEGNARPGSSAGSENGGPDSPADPRAGSGGEEEEEDRLHEQQLQQQQHLFPPNYGLGRRTSVSAESLNPSSYAADNWTPPRHPKTAEQLARLKKALSNIILFNHLDEDQMHTVLDALVEKPVPAKGIKIIAQGDQGDFFYVIETGKFDVYKHDSGSVQSGPGGLGTKVATLKEGEFFGELALMYNAPRSASIVSANARSTVWALDRITFRRILLDAAFARRRMYEAFLEEVPILASLKPYERAKVADALHTVRFPPGATIIAEGEPGNAFYLLESGAASAYKRDATDRAAPVMRYQRGDYFGELALLNDKPRQASIVADTNVTVAMLHRDGFMRLLGPVQNIMRRTSYDAGRPSNAAEDAAAAVAGNVPARQATQGGDEEKAGEASSQQPTGSRHDGASDAPAGNRDRQGVRERPAKPATSSESGVSSVNGKKRLRGSSDEAER